VLDCEKPGVICAAGSPRYKQVLEFHMVALPSGIRAHQVLHRLITVLVTVPVIVMKCSDAVVRSMSRVVIVVIVM